MKGVSGNLSILDLTVYLSTANEIIKLKQFDSFPTVYDKILKEYKSINAFASDIKLFDHKKIKMDYDKTAVENALNKLIDSYEDMNPDSCEEHLEELEK